MEEWKERLKAEYKEMKERIDKLHRWNVKKEAEFRMRTYGADKIEDDMNRGLCRDQEEVMTRYMNILELRAEVYGIEL